EEELYVPSRTYLILSEVEGRTTPLQRHRNVLTLAARWEGLFTSPPLDPREEVRDLAGGAVGVLAVREVADTREEGEIEVAEGLAEAVGPLIGEERIVRRPAHASRRRNRRQDGPLALQHGDAACMGAAVMREAAGKIAGLEEIVDEDLEHVVEG